MARLDAGTAPVKPGAEGMHLGRGKVQGVDEEAGSVELDHEPIPGLRWPGMTMEFQVRDRKQLAGLKPGDKVEFALGAKPQSDGSYVIESIRK